MTEINKTRILSSLFWKFLERGGALGLQFLVQVVLARLLLPEDFGTIALVYVFISISVVFVESGFGIALVQKKEVDEVDFSSVFYLSILVSTLFYFLLFFTAPHIAHFYNMPNIVKIIRVLAANLVFYAINSIQYAIVARNFQFKLLFFRSTGALLVSGAVGITLAHAGYGLWAIVGQQITNQLAITLILWFTLRWRPRLLFSFARVRELFSFGWKLLFSSLLSTTYRELHNLVMGKIFDPVTLGNYNRGQQFPSFIVSNIDGSIHAVMFPVLATHQDDVSKVKNVMRRSILSSSFVVFPLMAGLAATAESVIRIVLTDKWLSSVPFLQIACAGFALMPIQTANLQTINALGRSDIFLRLEIFKKTIGMIILGVTAFWGIYAIAYGGVVTAILSSFINAIPNKKLLDYSYGEQVKDVAPSLFLSLFMGTIVYTLKWLGLSSGLTLAIQLATGVILYLGIAKMINMASYVYLIQTMKSIFSRKKNVC